MAKMWLKMANMRLKIAKMRPVGYVGAYLLREVSEGVWETAVHRRSARVAFCRGLLSTPGGLVEKQDAFDPHGIMQESIMFRRGIQRALLEATAFCIDSIDPSDVFELPSLPHQSATHKNYGVVLKTPLECAKPQHGFEWEMTVGGVEDIGTPIPGGFHSWMSLASLLQRSDVVPECRRAIEVFSKVLKVGVLSSSVSGALSFTWPLIFRFAGAHNLEQVWTCSQCKPWWHHWYCRHCRKCVPPAWTCQKHWGTCSEDCGCCRFEFGEAFGCCEACENLWVLKATCWEVRLALLRYDGR